MLVIGFQVRWDLGNHLTFESPASDLCVSNLTSNLN